MALATPEFLVPASGVTTDVNQVIAVSNTSSIDFLSAFGSGGNQDSSSRTAGATMTTNATSFRHFLYLIRMVFFIKLKLK